jgi:hypothetical protein
MDALDDVSLDRAEHPEMLKFQLVFIDEKGMASHTWGYINHKAGGVVLFVRQSSASFRALWIPRHALKNIYMERVDLPPVCPPTWPSCWAK